MLKMFNKGPKVIKGKETKDNAKKPFALFGKNKSASAAKKQATPLANIFDKFNKIIKAAIAIALCNLKIIHANTQFITIIHSLSLPIG